MLPALERVLGQFEEYDIEISEPLEIELGEVGEQDLSYCIENELYKILLERCNIQYLEFSTPNLSFPKEAVSFLNYIENMQLPWETENQDSYDLMALSESGIEAASQSVTYFKRLLSLISTDILACQRFMALSVQSADTHAKLLLHILSLQTQPISKLYASLVEKMLGIYPTISSLILPHLKDMSRYVLWGNRTEQVGAFISTFVFLKEQQLLPQLFIHGSGDKEVLFLQKEALLNSPHNEKSIATIQNIEPFEGITNAGAVGRTMVKGREKLDEGPQKQDFLTQRFDDEFLEDWRKLEIELLSLVSQIANDTHESRVIDEISLHSSSEHENQLVNATEGNVLQRTIVNISNAIDDISNVLAASNRLDSDFLEKLEFLLQGIETLHVYLTNAHGLSIRQTDKDKSFPKEKQQVEGTDKKKEHESQHPLPRPEESVVSEKLFSEEKIQEEGTDKKKEHESQQTLPRPEVPVLLVQKTLGKSGEGIAVRPIEIWADDVSNLRNLDDMIRELTVQISAKKVENAESPVFEIIERQLISLKESVASLQKYYNVQDSMPFEHQSTLKNELKKKLSSHDLTAETVRQLLRIEEILQTEGNNDSLTMKSQRSLKERLTDIMTTQPKIKERMPVWNSGLVIFQPFLRTFFSRVGLLNPLGDFKNDECRIRAAYLLHALTGTPNPPEEHLMILNKLLCGINIFIPLDYSFEITDEEQYQVDSVIKAVISNWTVIRNTSVKGFQETFVRRQGLIERSQNDWILRVESHGVDILLEDIPWNIHLITSAWMDYLIHVDWKTTI